MRKTKLRESVRKLNNQKDQARPGNMCLFHKDIDEHIENSTAQTIASYISSHNDINNQLDQWEQQQGSDRKNTLKARKSPPQQQWKERQSKKRPITKRNNPPKYSFVRNTTRLKVRGKLT